MRPIPRVQLRDRVAETILSEILQSELPVGDRLLPERELAQRLGVSRTVVRDALHQLREQGIVRVRQGGGNYFLGIDGRGETMRRLRDRTERVRVVLEVRRVLEPELAALAAVRATPSQLLGLERAVRAMDKDIRSGGPGFAGERDFQRRLPAAAGNAIFEDFMNVLGPRLAELRLEALLQGTSPEQSLEDHEQILRAIAGHNPSAARALMSEHIDKVGDLKGVDRLTGRGDYGSAAD